MNHIRNTIDNKKQAVIAIDSRKDKIAKELEYSSNLFNSTNAKVAHA